MKMFLLWYHLEEGDNCNFGFGAAVQANSAEEAIALHRARFEAFLVSHPESAKVYREWEPLKGELKATEMVFQGGIFHF